MRNTLKGRSDKHFVPDIEKKLSPHPIHIVR
jgi:hypothetical protein